MGTVAPVGPRARARNEIPPIVGLGLLNRLLPILLAVGLPAGCTASGSAVGPSASTIDPLATPNPLPPPVTTVELSAAGMTTMAGTVVAADLTETSGLVASRARSGAHASVVTKRAGVRVR